MPLYAHRIFITRLSQKKFNLFAVIIQPMKAGKHFFPTRIHARYFGTCYAYMNACLFGSVGWPVCVVLRIFYYLQILISIRR